MNISQRLRTCARHTGLDAVIELLNEAADEIDALQAIAQAPQAESEPVAFIQHLRDHETGAEETELVWERDEDLDGPLYWYTPLYTHHAPGMPDDVVRDAERYRWLLCNYLKFHLPDEAWKHGSLDAAIDAAMLAAKTGGAA